MFKITYSITILVQSFQKHSSAVGAPRGNLLNLPRVAWWKVEIAACYSAAGHETQDPTLSCSPSLTVSALAAAAVVMAAGSRGNGLRLFTKLYIWLPLLAAIFLRPSAAGQDLTVTDRLVSFTGARHSGRGRAARPGPGVATTNADMFVVSACSFTFRLQAGSYFAYVVPRNTHFWHCWEPIAGHQWGVS